MVHPEVKLGYNSIKVKYPVESEKFTEMFIGEFKSDNKYHLLGFRNEDHPGCSQESETNQDLGIVDIPKNKRYLHQLVKDEIFFIYLEKEKPYPVKYIASLNFTHID